ANLRAGNFPQAQRLVVIGNNQVTAVGGQGQGFARTRLHVLMAALHGKEKLHHALGVGPREDGAGGRNGRGPAFGDFALLAAVAAPVAEVPDHVLTRARGAQRLVVRSESELAAGVALESELSSEFLRAQIPDGEWTVLSPRLEPEQLAVRGERDTVWRRAGGQFADLFARRHFRENDDAVVARRGQALAVSRPGQRQHAAVMLDGARRRLCERNTCEQNAGNQGPHDGRAWARQHFAAILVKQVKPLSYPTTS